MALGCAQMVASHLGLNAQFTHPVATCWERLQQRPVFQRALATQHQAALDQGVPTTPAPDTRPRVITPEVRQGPRLQDDVERQFVV